MLFQKDYSFRGSHAEKVNRLTFQFDDNSASKIFNRNIDVYILAPLIGFLYGRKSFLDKSSNDTTKILAGQLYSEELILKYNYKLILLLDEKYESNFENRINKAFRNYGNESKETLDDEQLYENYVLGGVDVLYEKLIEKYNNSEDYINNLYDFLEEFHERYNNTVTKDQIIDLCVLARS